MDLPLTRRYRSKTLKEYIGGDKIISEILATLAKGHFPQVMAFYGESGCGKTTMSRLVTKEYLCENRDDKSGACGVCDYCRLVENYIETGETDELPNVVYINTADDNKKQDLDGIIEEASLPTFDGAWRVYIFDEFHMASRGQQNRLLNILEEPPAKVLFLFCTTEPEKVIATIRNRVQLAFTVRKPNLSELGGLLRRICKAEGVEFDADGIRMICTSANFVTRQSLGLLDRVIKTKNSSRASDVKEVLNITTHNYYLDFLKLFTVEDVNKFEAIRLLMKIKNEMSLNDFIVGLVAMMNRGIYLRYHADVEGISAEEVKEVQRVFGDLTDKDLLYLLKFLLSISDDIEANLMLLIFEGLNPLNTPSNNDIDALDVNDSLAPSAHEEKEVGLKTFRENNHISQERFVEEMSVEDDLGDLLFNLKGREN